MIVGIISMEVFQAGTETSYTLSLLHPLLGANIGKFNNSTFNIKVQYAAIILSSERLSSLFALLSLSK